MDFSLQEALLWIIDSCFGQKQQFKVKTSFFVSYKHAAFGFTRHELLDWSGVDYCDVFISCLDSYSDGTHSLQRTHCWASDGMLHFPKSVLIKKQTHLQLEWTEGEYIFMKCSQKHFWGELFVNWKQCIMGYIACNAYAYRRSAYCALYILQYSELLCIANSLWVALKIHLMN